MTDGLSYAAKNQGIVVYVPCLNNVQIDSKLMRSEAENFLPEAFDFRKL